MSGTVWGVYILWWGNQCLYVGKGHNGADDRLRSHRRKKWGRLITARRWQPANPNTEAAALELERRLIAELRPHANIIYQGRRGRRFAASVDQATTGTPIPKASPLWRLWPIAPLAAAALLAATALK